MISSAGQVDEVLRAQDQAEDVELARAQVEQHRLAAVPLQPGQAVEDQLRDPDQRPAPAGEPAADRARRRSSAASAYSETTAVAASSLGGCVGPTGFAGRLRRGAPGLSRRPGHCRRSLGGHAPRSATGSRRRPPARGSARPSGARSCAGMTLFLPLLIISTIAASPQPCSQILSVRFGAPRAWVALAVGAVAGGADRELGLAQLRGHAVVRAARQAQHVVGHVLHVLGLPTAAAIGGITPLRPSVMVSMIVSGAPPHSQSLSVRFGKPLLPRASEPWHCAQLLQEQALADAHGLRVLGQLPRPSCR